MLQRAPDTGELVIIGVDAIKPFMQLGIVSGICISIRTVLK
jgi:carotenoid cleavage dioxygenase